MPEVGAIVRSLCKVAAYAASTAGKAIEGMMSDTFIPVMLGTIGVEDGANPSEGAVAETSYDATLPPVVVGDPSPVFEPRSIEAGRYLGASLRPAIVADGWVSDDFAVRAASVRGLSHQWYGSPRQDDYVLSLTEAGWLVAGVADGVSAAEQSHVASSEVLQYLVGWFAEANPQSIGEIDFQELLEIVRWDLVEKERKLCPDVELPGRELATTISFAIVVPRTDGDGADVAVAGVGDSACWVLDHDGYDCKLGGKEEGEGGISDSTVQALPLLPEKVSPVTFTLQPGQVLLLGTDGVADPLGDGSGEVGAMLSDALLPPGFPSPLSFARIVDFSRETFDDDRTLVAVRLAVCGDEPMLAGDGDEPGSANKGADTATGCAEESMDDEKSIDGDVGMIPATVDAEPEWAVEADANCTVPAECGAVSS